MRTPKSLAAAALMGALLACAMPTQAAPVHFAFDDLNGVDLSFTIDTALAPDSAFPGISTSFAGIAATSGGSAITIDPIFYSLDLLGGLSALGYNLSGAQLYAAGTESAPVFLNGTYQLMGSFGDTTLVISEGSTPPPTPVPEPGVAALIALALAGATVARRRAA